MRFTRAQKPDIDASALGHQGAAYDTMGHRKKSAQRCCQPMYRSQAHLCQRDAGKQRGISHVGPMGGNIALIEVQAREAVAHGTHARHRQRIGKGIGARGDIGFEQLRERIHAVGRDQRRRAGREQFRIDHRIGGHQRFVTEGFLETACTLLRQHRIFRRLGAGPCSRRHRDERHRRAGVRQLRPHPFEKFHHAVGHAQQTGDSLGRIEHATATDADDNRDAFVAVTTRQCIGQCRRRLAGYGIVQPGNTMRIQCRLQGRPML